MWKSRLCKESLLKYSSSDGLVAGATRTGKSNKWCEAYLGPQICESFYFDSLAGFLKLSNVDVITNTMQGVSNLNVTLSTNISQPLESLNMLGMCQLHRFASSCLPFLL